MKPERLYLDSADLTEATAAASGVVAEITTNPSIMRAAATDFTTQLRRLLEVLPPLA